MDTHDGFRPLFTPITALFASSADTPNTFRARIRMRGDVDGDALRRAVDATMARYPYFCVELQRRDGVWGFADNPRPVTVSPSDVGVPLNSPASNYHLIAFSWQEDWLFLDTSHALTDGTGIYALLRTLLHDYCAARYGVELSREGIRQAGDPIPPEEWEDPAPRFTDAPPEDGGNGGSLSALNPMLAPGLVGDAEKTVFSASVSEDAFMRFTSAHDGSPGTMVALFLSRAFAALHPDNPNPIRVGLCVNLRPALGAPLAHQSLVGGAGLEYKPRMRQCPLTTQATMYRGMVFAQTRTESLLTQLSYINRNARQLLSMASDGDRVLASQRNGDAMKRTSTATVSYVGKAGLGDAERYIRDFHMWANALYENMLVEISAVNGRFIFDCSQNFRDPRYWRAFLDQLRDNGIAFEEYPAMPLRLPEIRLPWIRPKER